MRPVLACCVGCIGLSGSRDGHSRGCCFQCGRPRRLPRRPHLPRGRAAHRQRRPLVHKGKIVAVGPADDTPIPEGAEVVDLTGKTIIPGLVDTHSHIGIWPRPHVPANSDGNEGSGAVQSGLRALDAIYPDDPGIRMAVAGGVTTANIMPGSGNVIGGQTVYVKLRGRTVEEMRIAAAQRARRLEDGQRRKPQALQLRAPQAAARPRA